MAVMESIDAARVELEEAVLEVQQLVQSYIDLTGDNSTPPWLFVLCRRFDRIDAASEAYMMAVHKHARPVLKDLAEVNKTLSGSGR